MDDKIKKKFIAGLSILIGTAIGAGFLGIPYVASKAGFLTALFYIIFLGLVILFSNLYLGEIILRTKGKHHLGGYAERYLGKRGRFFMNFALVFSVYSAILAYIVGTGESFSYLFFGNSSYSFLIGLAFAFLMSFLIWFGLKGLKKYEKIGVGIIFGLFVSIILTFAGKISIENLSGFNPSFLFLPFGVVLFALLSFLSIPEINFVVGKDKKIMKKILVLGSLIPVIFYALFAFVIVGFKGIQTPEIATFALGPAFVILGILTMFTSYFVLGNVMQDHFLYDFRYKKSKSWFLASIVPIILFLLIQTTDFFSFTKILSIGGVVSGGLIAVLILLIISKAKKIGDRKPEYSIPINRFVIWFLGLIFVLGIIREIIEVFG